MASEEEEGLDLLIKQRQFRPSYNRVLSNEFTNADVNNLEKHKQPGKGNKKATAPNIAMSSGACDSHERKIEMEAKNETDSDSSGESEEYQSASEDISTSNPNLEEISSDEPGLNMGGIGGASSNEDFEQPKCQTRLSTRRRCRKEQRRRLRRERLENLPFTNDDCIDFELEKSKILNTKFVEVPTLVKLCLETYCRRHIDLDNLPYGLQADIRAKIYSRSNRKALNKFIYKVLADEERDIKAHYDIARVQSTALRYNVREYSRFDRTENKHLKNQKHSPMLSHSCSSGSIWSMPDLYQWGIQTYQYGHLLDRKHDTNPREWTWKGALYNYSLSVLIHVIDLHLPRSYISKGYTAISEDQATKRMKRACEQVKDHLSQTFPNVVDMLYEKALPYVWWSRGNSVLAEEAFLTLIEDSSLLKTDNEKALFMNELARMYIHFGEYGKALRFYTMAADVPVELLTCDLLNLQTKILIASLQSMGICCSRKLTAAMSAWNDILEKPLGDDFNTCVTAAIDTVMCYFSGTTSEFQSTEQWLEKHVSKYPKMYFALSLLHAMKGEKRESLHAFRMFEDRYSTNDGSQYNVHLTGRGWGDPHDHSINPFQYVVLQAQKQPIRLMKTIWRMQPWHLSLDNERKHYVGDEDHEEMKIWRTSDGFIACDVHLMLPSIPQVVLHPLTGELQLDRSEPVVCYRPKLQGMFAWAKRGFSLDPKEYPSYGISFPQRIYEDDNVKVDLTERVTSNGNKSFFTETMLQSQYSDGEILQLNLKRLIRDKIVEETKAKILSEADSQPGHKRSSFIKKQMDVLQKHIKCGLDCQLSDLQKTIKYDLLKLEAKEDKKKRCPRKPHVDLFGPRLVEKATLPGAIFFLFCLDNRTDKLFNYHPNVLMVINLKDKDHFSQPTIMRLTNTSYVPFNTKIGYKDDRFWFMGSNHQTNENLRFDRSQSVIHVLTKEDSKPALNNFTPLVLDPEGKEVHLVDYVNYDNDHFVYGLHGIIRDCFFKMDKTNESLEIVSAYVGRGDQITVSLNAMIHKFLIIMGNLFILTEDSLVVVDTVLGILPWTMYNPGTTLLVEETHLMLHHRTSLELLKMDTFSTPLTAHPGPVVRAAVGYGNHLLIIEMPAGGERTGEVHCWLDIEVLGKPMEVCFIGEKGDFMVAATVHDPSHKEYEENLYQYSPVGHLVAILPCLGRGPHGFFTLFHPGLPTKPEERDRKLQKLCEQYPDVPYDEPGWFIYFADGHGAIACAWTQCVQ